MSEGRVTIGGAGDNNKIELTINEIELIEGVVRIRTERVMGPIPAVGPDLITIWGKDGSLLGEGWWDGTPAVRRDQAATFTYDLVLQAPVIPPPTDNDWLQTEDRHLLGPVLFRWKPRRRRRGLRRWLLRQLEREAYVRRWEVQRYAERITKPTRKDNPK